MKIKPNIVVLFGVIFGLSQFVFRVEAAKEAAAKEARTQQFTYLALVANSSGGAPSGAKPVVTLPAPSTSTPIPASVTPPASAGGMPTATATSFVSPSASATVQVTAQSTPQATATPAATATSVGATATATRTPSPTMTSPPVAGATATSTPTVNATATTPLLGQPPIATTAIPTATASNPTATPTNTATAPVLPTATATPVPTVAAESCAPGETERALAELIGKHSQQQRSGFTCHPILERVAREHAQDMIAQNYIAHVNPDGIGPNEMLRRAGFALPSNYSTDVRANNVEALAVGTDFTTPQLALNAWLASAGHRRQILAEGSTFFAAQVEYGIAHIINPGTPDLHYWIFISAKRK